jgi:NADH dehydrogenase [ubiquinone] 1 alpha subcomplex assembly factor 6
VRTQEQDAVSDGPATLAELEKYAESTASSLLYLSLESVGVRDAGADHVASHVGKASGSVTALRGLPFHSSRQQRYVPLDLLEKQGLTADSLWEAFASGSAPTHAGVREVVFALASQAHAHMQHAAELTSSIPPSATPALLPAVSDVNVWCVALVADARVLRRLL